MLRELIDFTEPVGLLMTAVLHFVADGSDPWGLVARYVAAAAPGSYLALSHFTADKMPPRAIQAARTPTRRPRRASTRGRWPRSSGSSPGWTWCRRTPGTDAGVSYVGVWGAEDPVAADSDGSRGLYCGVARRS